MRFTFSPDPGFCVITKPDSGADIVNHWDLAEAEYNAHTDAKLFAVICLDAALWRRHPRWNSTYWERFDARR